MVLERSGKPLQKEGTGQRHSRKMVPGEERRYLSVHFIPTRKALQIARLVNAFLGIVDFLEFFLGSLADIFAQG